MAWSAVLTFFNKRGVCGGGGGGEGTKMVHIQICFYKVNGEAH